MNTKIKVKQRNINKLLKYIATYKASKNGVVLLDARFYNGLTPMSRITINQTLNAMDAEGLIENRESMCSDQCIAIALTSKAFAYRLRRRQDFTKFLIPTIISMIALLKAFDKEILLLLELLKPLLK